MPTPSRMPRYDIRNDGIGPYAVFYCDQCDREYRSKPDIAGNAAKDIGRQAAGGLLRNIPLFGGALADNISGEDQRYSTNLSPQQLEAAWQQVKPNFRECPTCLRVVCLSDFDIQADFCQEDSPRRNEMAEAEAQQAGNVIKGFAAAFGLGDVVKGAAEAAKRAGENTACCPKDGTVAPAGTKFCPECGSAMVQPSAAAKCPSCGAQVKPGTKFCPECGGKVEQPAAQAACPSCGAQTQGAKFCPECGTKVA